MKTFTFKVEGEFTLKNDGFSESMFAESLSVGAELRIQVRDILANIPGVLIGYCLEFPNVEVKEK